MYLRIGVFTFFEWKIVLNLTDTSELPGYTFRLEPIIKLPGGLGQSWLTPVTGSHNYWTV